MTRSLAKYTLLDNYYEKMTKSILRGSVENKYFLRLFESCYDIKK